MIYRTEVLVPRSVKSREDKALREANKQLKKELARKEKALAETAALRVLHKKVPGVLGGKGVMTPLPEREQLLGYFNEAVEAGARKAKAAEIMGLSLRTLQCWQPPEALPVDARTLRMAAPTHKFSETERGEYMASEASFYQILRQANQMNHRQASQVQQPRSKPKALTRLSRLRLIAINSITSYFQFL